MTIYWNIILIACGALQAGALIFLLLRKKAFFKSYLFLAAYLLVLIFQIVFKIADKVWLMNFMTKPYSISYHFPLLYGPLIWMFALSMFSKSRVTLLPIAHFVPFLICAAFEDYIFNGWFLATLQLISIAVYHYNAFCLWATYNKKFGGHFSDIHFVRMRWFRKFAVASFITCAAISVLLAFIYTTFPTYSYLRFGFVLITLLVYWISYHAMKQPALFTAIVNKNHDADRVATLHTPSVLTFNKPSVKYASSSLSAPEAIRIENELLALVLNRKIYTDPDLTIDTLASELHTNRHALSQVLNQRLGQTFYDFINQNRISEAKRLLKYDNNIKIASIAFDSGFNSLSAFNDAFKKMTGTTPSLYRKLDHEGLESAASLPA